jgi:hypothetical protein
VDLNPGSTQGSQYGDGNVQYNVWQAGRQLDPASLGALNPDKAAEFIGAMPHDDAVLVLASADVDAAAATLDVLLKTDEARAVSLLTSLSRRKAEAVIAVVAADMADREWLGDLPEATAATGKRAAELKLAAPGPLEYLCETLPGTASGYLRTYKNGQVCWRRPPFTAPQALAIMGVILEHHVRSGGISGRLGFPKGEERPVGAAADGRWVQVFSGGAIYRHETSVTEVEGLIADYLFASTDGYHRYPLGPAVVRTPQSPSGYWGLMQRFGGSWDSYDETVYFSKATMTCGVRGAIASYYDQLGGPSSWLGYPTTRQSYRDGRSIQDFQGGTVFVGPDRTVAVPAASMELIRRDESVEKRLGFPVTEDEPTGTSDDRWQFFENGVVTVRDGNREVWVRP